MPKPAGTSCFWEWIRVGPIPGLERVRQTCDWKGELGRPLTQMYLLWKAPRETFKVSLWTPLASGAKLSVPPPTGLFLCSKQLPVLYGACFLLWLFFDATWHFSIAATGEKTSADFFPSLSTFQSSCRKANVLSTLFFPHLTSPFQSWGERWTCVVHHKSKSSSYSEPTERVGLK